MKGVGGGVGQSVGRRDAMGTGRVRCAGRRWRVPSAGGGRSVASVPMVGCVAGSGIGVSDAGHGGQGCAETDGDCACPKPDGNLAMRRPGVASDCAGPCAFRRTMPCSHSLPPASYRDRMRTLAILSVIWPPSSEWPCRLYRSARLLTFKWANLCAKLVFRVGNRQYAGPECVATMQLWRRFVTATRYLPSLHDVGGS